MSGWGVMNQVAIKEAAGINFPMDHFVGNWWSGSDADVVPAGDGSKGYKSAAFHGAGANWKVHEDIVKYVYGGDKAKAMENKLGEVLYNRTLVNAMYGVEAVRTAQKKYGNKPMVGDNIRWGLENLNITEGRLAEIGMKGMLLPLKVSCIDHETGGPILIQQWDGSKWNVASDWIKPIREVVRPLVEEAAKKFAKENKITPRKC